MPDMRSSRTRGGRCLCPNTVYRPRRRESWRPPDDPPRLGATRGPETHSPPRERANCLHLVRGREDSPTRGNARLVFVYLRILPANGIPTTEATPLTAQNTYDHARCAECGGSCCLGAPGCCLPDDIARLFPASTLHQSVELALAGGRFAIDWWEGEPCIPFMRPATKGKEGVSHDPSWGGNCTFLREHGCELGDQERPHQCRVLRPNADIDQCKAPDGWRSKFDYACQWKETGIDLMAMGKEEALR